MPHLPMALDLPSLPPDGGEKFNRLVFSQSPYLLQHAANPVDWYPWGKEAFEKALKEDKPVFLSVGYSTCHWCHVMERESFEDEEVAALMNKFFVCIKVDREERPDIDKVYMDVTQALTGGGGWPMTVIMTPDKKPFFAGTYFPKNGRFGRPGLMQLLPQLGAAWKNDRAKVMEAADGITQELQKSVPSKPGPAPTPSTLTKAFEQLRSSFDSEHGGFSRAPKFPVPHNLMFLLRYWKRTGDPAALQMVEKTLREMRAGGIFDHIGFGFHRYSTDPEWLVPHFEKMLYDQALLAMAYVETYQATGNEFYARTAREIFTYVLRNMTSPDGGFYSAEDADSEGVEGKFYLWTPQQVAEVVGEEAARKFDDIYNIVPGGNFNDEAAGHKTGENIPHLERPLFEKKTDLEDIREQLFRAREKRVHPLKDDKILTDWNGLMIAALAKGGEALGEPAYRAAAVRAADFILRNMRDDKGRLLKRSRLGAAGLCAHLEDYAFFVWGLIEVYESTFEPGYLAQAVDLTDDMLSRFWDDENGGFFLTADDSEQLLVRSKDIYDGATPSGNSVAALNLIRLSRLTGDSTYETRAEEIMKAFPTYVARAPSNLSVLMMALNFAVGPSYEVVISGDQPDDLLRELRKGFVPNKVVLLRPDGDTPITRLSPFTEPLQSIDGKATAYVCRNFACALPTTDAGEMIKLLKPSE
ncbi:MAG: thioredoxin domain-containing protein [Verrucomicrobia bacterium]|nr:thioredoxin domain-containing protein [Verrucomicrobiota bacterium]